MKIGIYDKWLRELGGGEKVATVMAETLSKEGHKVDLISLTTVDNETLEKRMGVDLSKVKLVTWFDRRQGSLTKETRKYDLFINVGYLDHLPSEAKKSIYYILFPTPIRKSFMGFIKYETILPFLRKFLVIPEITAGLEDIEDIVADKGGKWVKKENQMVFSNSPKNMILTLRFYIEDVKLSKDEYLSFSSPNSKLQILDIEIDTASNVIAYKIKVKREEGDASVLEFKLSKKAKIDEIALMSITIKNPRYFLWNVIKRHLPGYEMALYGSARYKPAAGLLTYDKFLADSKFSAHWTKKYWNKDSEVLYPPVDVHEFKGGKKKNVILSVGRFFAGGHSKKQDVLVESFKKMVDGNLVDESWELHFVGGIARGENNAEYVKKIKNSAKGYPVFFHFSAPFNELKKLYSEAKIYWHASGFGESNREPIMFEHFGITPVEAMAAGCVPVVFNGGGLVETVGSNPELLWKDEKELINKTLQIINNESKRVKLSKRVKEEAQKYSRKNFADELLKYVQEISTKV